MSRQVKFKKNETIACCPRCGNNTRFIIYLCQTAEDCCEVWAECVCGYDPTAEDTGNRLESVWGGTDDSNVHMAIDCWSNAVLEASEATT